MSWRTKAAAREADIAFLARLRTASESELVAMLVQYRMAPEWKIVAIKRALRRHATPYRTAGERDESFGPPVWMPPDPVNTRE